VRRILIALDQSEEALNVVRYVAGVVGGREGVEVTLYHVIREFMPLHPEFDLGVLPEVQARFEESSRQAMDKVFGEARRLLLAAGFTPANIKTKIEPAGVDVAQEILSGAEKGGYDTIAMGRRGMGRLRQFFMGSVSTKVVQHAKGRTVWIVE
jgi:nucleotide-binding universal stress UspA family protein